MTSRPHDLPTQGQTRPPAAQPQERSPGTRPTPSPMRLVARLQRRAPAPHTSAIPIDMAQIPRLTRQIGKPHSGRAQTAGPTPPTPRNASKRLMRPTIPACSRTGKTVALRTFQVQTNREGNDIDDADSFISHAVYCNAIKLDGFKVPTFIYCITNVTYSYVINNERLSKMFGDVFWLGIREEDDIKKIILESPKNTLKSNTKHLKFFDDYSLNQIVNYSFGLPGLTSFFILSCLKIAYQASSNKIERKLIKRVADIEGFTLAKKIIESKFKFRWN